MCAGVLPRWNEMMVSLSSSIMWTRRPLMPITAPYQKKCQRMLLEPILLQYDPCFRTHAFVCCTSGLIYYLRAFPVCNNLQISELVSPTSWTWKQEIKIPILWDWFLDNNWDFYLLVVLVVETVPIFEIFLLKYSNKKIWVWSLPQ